MCSKMHTEGWSREYIGYRLNRPSWTVLGGFGAVLGYYFRIREIVPYLFGIIQVPQWGIVAVQALALQTNSLGHRPEPVTPHMMVFGIHSSFSARSKARVPRIPK